MTCATLAARNLLRRPARTILSALGVGVGIGALVAFVSLARGFREQFSRIIATTGAELVVQQKGAADPGQSSVTPDDIDRMRGLPGVTEVCPSAFTVISRWNEPLLVLGREPGARLMRKYRILEGTTLVPGNEDDILIGKTAAAARKLKVGDTLTLREQTFRIVGRFEVAEAVPLENNCVVTTLRALQRLMRKENRVHIAFVYVNDPRDVDPVGRRIEEACPALEAIRAGAYIEKGFRQQLDAAEQFAWAISSLAMIVAGIVVLLVMLTNVSERTREIGTLRALGWSRRAVLGLVLQEGMLLSLLGGAVGIGLGIAGAEAIVWRWKDGFLYPHFSMGFFAEALTVAIGLGLAGTAYPAWRAAGLPPVEALRYE